MTKKDFEKLGKRLLPELPNFAVKGQLLFIQPIGHTLRAVCFDGSSFDPDLFFVHVFLQPLFIPAKHIGLNLGWRIGGGSYRWNVNVSNLQTQLSAALRREALPFLIRIESAQDVVAAIESLGKSADPYAQQAIAYAWARAGDIIRAIKELERLVRMLDVKVPWQHEIAERAETLKTKLADPTQAQRQFEVWENESAENLGLEKFRQ